MTTQFLGASGQISIQKLSFLPQLSIAKEPILVLDSFFKTSACNWIQSSFLRNYTYISEAEFKVTFRVHWIFKLMFVNVHYGEGV